MNQGGKGVNTAWKSVQPKDSFMIAQHTKLSNLDLKSIAMLYQPIMGVQASGLYHALMSYAEEEHQGQKQWLHSDILMITAMDIPQFYQARLKLEGIGLLKTFVQERVDSRQFFYQLIPPVAPEKFFQDDIFSSLLMESVGQRLFERLTKIFLPEKVSVDDFLEITKPFTDVYQFQLEKISDQGRLLEQDSASMPSIKQDLSILTETFDWDFFLSLVKDLRLDRAQLTELKPTLLLFHEMYGINELEMQKFVSRAVNFTTSQIEVKKLRQLIYEWYHETRQESAIHEVPQKLEKQNQIERERALKINGYPDEVIRVILSSESVAPMEFLKSIKDQKNGFVTQDERWAIETLMKQSMLPYSVINILIHYILVIQGQATFNQKYANTIANDWAQAYIHTPEAAIDKIQETVEKSLEKKTAATQRRSYRKSTNQRKETLPEWAETTTEIQETPISIEDQKRLEAAMKKLEQFRQGGGE